MGAGTGGAGWASAHPGKNQGGHGPPWKFQPWSDMDGVIEDFVRLNDQRKDDFGL